MSLNELHNKFDQISKEASKLMPLVILKDGSIGYDSYIIRKNSLNKWQVYYIKKSVKVVIDTFFQKTCAILSAYYHKHNKLKDLIENKNIDNSYWSNHFDSIWFNKLYKTTQDEVKRDIFLWRYELCQNRADIYKEKITYEFSKAFK